MTEVLYPIEGTGRKVRNRNLFGGWGKERWSSLFDFGYVLFKTQMKDTIGNLGSRCNSHFFKFGFKGRLEVAES